MTVLQELSDIYDEGFVRSPTSNPYYMGLWPCHQAAADPDSGQVTDISGRGAHAGLGALSVAEAWANAGFVSSVATADKCARIPLPLWPFRFTAGNLILFAYQRMVMDGVNNLRILGNATNTSNTGFNVCCTSAGGLQVNIVNSVGVSFFSSGTTGADIPYATDSLHSWMMAYRKSTNGFFIYIDGVKIRNEDGSISRTNVQLADASVTSGPAFGGRPGATSLFVAVRTKWVHALNIESPKDLPTNLDVIAKRLHSAPHLELPEEALIWT